MARVDDLLAEVAKLRAKVAELTERQAQLIAHATAPPAFVCAKTGGGCAYRTEAAAEDRPYACSICGASGVKLWRQYQTLAERVLLMCLEHALEDQKANLSSGRFYPNGDQIGWLVPAVPVDNTFWGYTSVPQDRVDWWKALPDVDESVPSGDCS